MADRVLKGGYGYLKAQGKREWIKTLLLFCISLGLLILGMCITKYRFPEKSWSESRNNLLTVAAVLGVLPSARFLINAIMFRRAAKYACPEKLFRQLDGVTECSLCYDLYLTAYKEVYPLYACVCTENEVLGLLAGDNALAGRGEEHLRSILKKEGRKDVSVKFFVSESSFLERVKKTSGDSEKCSALMAIVLQVSL